MCGCSWASIDCARLGIVDRTGGSATDGLVADDAINRIVDLELEGWEKDK